MRNKQREKRLGVLERATQHREPVAPTGGTLSNDPAYLLAVLLTLHECGAEEDPELAELAEQDREAAINLVRERVSL